MFSELFGLAAGGMVVPGYFALYLNRPIDVVLTILAALATYMIVYLMCTFIIVYGRRRTVLMILVGYLVRMLFNYIPMDFITLRGALCHGPDRVRGHRLHHPGPDRHLVRSARLDRNALRPAHSRRGDSADPYTPLWRRTKSVLESLWRGLQATIATGCPREPHNSQLDQTTR